MAFDIQSFLDNIGIQFNATVTTPALPSPGGGARLKRISAAYPLPGEDLGMVIASPNILRPYHPGFDPTDQERVNYEGDFFDKLIYVDRKSVVSDLILDIG